MFKNSNMVAEDKQCYKVKVFHSYKNKLILFCAKNLMIIIILTNVNSLFFIVLFSILLLALAAIPLTNFYFL